MCRLKCIACNFSGLNAIPKNVSVLINVHKFRLLNNNALTKVLNIYTEMRRKMHNVIENL